MVLTNCKEHLQRVHKFTTKNAGNNQKKNRSTDFDVLLTVHLSIYISVFNQLDAQNLFHSKFYFMPLHVSSTCAQNM